MALQRAGVPPLYAEAVWEHCRVTDLLKPFVDDIKQQVAEGRGALLIGPVGTGKSSAAGLIVKGAVMEGLSVRWSYVPDMLGRMSEWKHREYWVQEECRPHMTVWDDFNVSKMSAVDIGNLDRIVENRYRRRMSMIITTNMTADSLKRFEEGGRMVDRWRERTTMYTIPGESMRLTWRDR